MKRLLIKLLPEKLRIFFIKNKYKNYALNTHMENLKYHHTIKINANSMGLKSILYKIFLGFIKIDSTLIYFLPAAVIKIPNSPEEYLRFIGSKSRNMINKAKKNHINCKIFVWNDYLDDIYKINTSTSFRQGIPMGKAYQEYPSKFYNCNNNDLEIMHLGAFIDEKLVGYIELYIYGNFAMINKILGHKDYFKFSIINLLVYECVLKCIEKEIKYLNYLTMSNKKTNSLSAFKYRLGFREYSILRIED